jgi:hypothetical protein
VVSSLCSSTTGSWLPSLPKDDRLAALGQISPGFSKIQAGGGGHDQIFVMRI